MSKNRSLKVLSHSPQDTEALGSALASTLEKGDLLCLYGALGSGKTTFVRGLARGLGLQQPVRSPSFTLIHEYPLPDHPAAYLFHIDLYRLEEPAQIDPLGLEEYFERGLCVMEWADRAGTRLPTDRLEIYFEILSDTQRQLSFILCGPTIAPSKLLPITR